MRHLQPLCLLAALAAAGLAACVHDAPASPEPNADFSWEPCFFKCPLSNQAMAAGGARAVIGVTLNRVNLGPIASVSSSNPQVASFTYNSPFVHVISGDPGDTDLILLNSNGLEIARGVVAVKATTSLGLEGILANSGGATPTILAGSSQVLDATTKNGTETLVGVGAVKFTPSGTVRRDPFVIIFDDSYPFVADPGTGSVAADCIESHIVIPVSAVPSTAITNVMLSVPSLTFAGTDKGKTVDVSVFAGTSRIYGARCTWTTTPLAGLNISLMSVSVIGGPYADTYLFSGAAGNYSATCTVDGGKSATLAVAVN